MKPAYVLALDQGTTSARAVVVDGAGNICGFDQRELTQSFPRPGWVEHDPGEIWGTQLAAARGALRAAAVEARDLAAIGIANQRETTVLWERESGRPVYPAIVWQDRRTAEACADLEARGFGALVASKTGLRLDPYFSATKIVWLLDHVDGLRERAERGAIAFGTVDSWLLWNLTGGVVHATDYTNAARTALFDLERLAAGEIEALASQVADSGGVVFVPAFTGLGAKRSGAGRRRVARRRRGVPRTISCCNFRPTPSASMSSARPRSKPRHSAPRTSPASRRDFGTRSKRRLENGRQTRASRPASALPSESRRCASGGAP